jgi:signal recognition particle subunit SRP54
LRFLEAGDHPRQRAQPAHAAHLTQLRAQVVHVELTLGHFLGELFRFLGVDRLASRMLKGQFDLNDLRSQLKQMQNMGGLGMLASMMPGMKKAKQAMAQSGVDDKVLVHMDAIIGSMTPKERQRPELMNAKRKKRVAAGSGTEVQDVNKLLKMHQEMGRAMKQIRKMGGLKGLGALLGGGGMGGLGGLGGASGGAPPSLPGLGGGPANMGDLLRKK